jgi:hypothetical protein
VVFASIGIAETATNAGLVSNSTILTSSELTQRNAVIWAAVSR